MNIYVDISVFISVNVHMRTRRNKLTNICLQCECGMYVDAGLMT